jgi:hypothetical protein
MSLEPIEITEQVAREATLQKLMASFSTIAGKGRAQTMHGLPHFGARLPFSIRQKVTRLTAWNV